MRNRFAAIACLVALAAPLEAAGQGRNLLRPDGWTAIEFNSVQPGLAPLPPAEHGPGLRITVRKAAEPFYATQVAQPVREAIPRGARLRLQFWARSETKNPLRAVVEKSDAPFNAVTEWSGVLGAAWKQYSVIGTSSGFDSGGLSVRLQVGHAPGIIECSGISLEDLGPDPALAAARAAIQPDAIQRRIRRYRMGDLTVSVRDSHGRPQKNVRVRVEQTRHAFLFGCNIFALDPGSDATWQKAYQARFTELFNYATLPFYWGSFEPERGKPDYARLDAMAAWCLSHGLVPKGHPLIWHEVWPAWAPKTADDSIPLLKQRVADILGHFKGSTRYWDVLNEANAAPNYPQTGEGNWILRDGAAAVVETALHWARDFAEPGSTLIYNDFDTSEKNVALLSALRDRKALPDAIGIQSHMHGGTWPLEQLWATTERFAPFGKPIHYTETTVISGENRSFDFRTPPTSWPSTPEGEQKQADYLAQFYSLLFSHPSVRAITYWDFSDRNAWLNAPAGLLRADMSPKPAYTRLMDLIHRQWWTDSTQRTDAHGQSKLRAFYGDYRITVSDAKGRSTSRRISFPMGSSTRAVELRVP